MEPSLSEALAEIVTSEPLLKLELLTGLVILTVGEPFTAFTVMLTAEDVVVLLPLSVAFAVKL